MFPRRAAAAAVAALSALLAAAPAAAAELTSALESLVVVMNDVTMLETQGDIRTILVASPDIADASVATPRKLLLLAKKPGVTTVLVLDAGGERLLGLSVLVAPADKGVVTVDRGVKETVLTCSPRCVSVEMFKDTTGGATPAPASNAALPSALPPLPGQPSAGTPPASGSPPGAPGGASGGAPPLSLKPPVVQLNQ